MIKRLGNITGFNKRNINRIHRMTTLGVIMLFIMIVTMVITGWMVHAEIMVTYAENYYLLTSAGFEQLVVAPQVVSDRIMVLLSVIPLMGIGLVFPIIFKAACELYRLEEAVMGNNT